MGQGDGAVGSSVLSELGVSKDSCWEDTSDLGILFYFMPLKNADKNMRPRIYPCYTIYASSLPPARLQGFVTEIGSDL